MLAALLALLAALALRLQWTVAIPLVWMFNVEGTLDLIIALFQGLRNVEAGALQAAYFVPAIAMPALLVTHGMIFRLFLKREKNSPVDRESRQCRALTSDPAALREKN